MVKKTDFEKLSGVLKKRRQGQKVILVTGCFDLLHQEHLNFLKKARAAGDILLVGLEGDERVKKLKGAGRPVNTQQKRLAKIQKLPFVDFVFLLPKIFDDDQAHEDLVKQLKPDVLAVSSHTPHLDKKRKIMEKYSGILKVVYQHNPDVSTTKIVNEKGNFIPAIKK